MALSSENILNSLLTLSPLDPIISIVGRCNIDNLNNDLVNHIVVLFKVFIPEQK